MFLKPASAELEFLRIDPDGFRVAGERTTSPALILGALLGGTFGWPRRPRFEA